MEAEARDQANAAMLLNQTINERVAEALLAILNDSSNPNALNAPGLMLPVTSDRVLHSLVEHPLVKTRIYAMAAETARMLVTQAFKEFGERTIPTTFFGATQMQQPYGYIYNADSLPKQRFF